MKATTTTNVGGTSIVIGQHCGQGLLTDVETKSMDQGKAQENTSTQETVWEL